VLFVLGAVWALVASVQDVKTTFVANWLTYSLVIFGLVYRLFYGVVNDMIWFFWIGLIGFAVFFILAYVFYYAKVFGGGDAKLLMGLGVLLPYSNIAELGYFAVLFLVLFFAVGGVYSLIGSIVLMIKKWKMFKKEFDKRWQKDRNWLLLFVPIAILLLFWVWFNWLAIVGVVLIGLLPLIYISIKALDECMIVSKSGDELLEGDWLMKDVMVNGKKIKKTVHGLSLEDIRLLKKSKKKVLIKEGIAFVPVFLITFVLEYCFILWWL
jgi:Flp pilus assembly protein protease CpaA